MENGGRKWRLGGPNGLEFHGIPCLLLSIPIEGSRERETGKARSGGETGGASGQRPPRSLPRAINTRATRETWRYRAARFDLVFRDFCPVFYLVGLAPFIDARDCV